MLRVIRWSFPTTLGELLMIPRIHESEEFGRLNESVEKQVKPFVAGKVKALCESFMLSVITLKTLVPVYRELYRLMLMLAMQMLRIVL